MLGMVLGMPMAPMLTLGCAMVSAARQERMWTRVLTENRCRVCSKPMLDLSLSKRVSIMNRLRNTTLSSRGSKSFFMLRRMLVTKCRPRCQRRSSSAWDRYPLSAKIFPCRAVVMASSGLRSSLLPAVILKAMIWPL